MLARQFSRKLLRREIPHAKRFSLLWKENLSRGELIAGRCQTQGPVGIDLHCSFHRLSEQWIVFIMPHQQGRHVGQCPVDSSTISALQWNHLHFPFAPQIMMLHASLSQVSRRALRRVWVFGILLYVLADLGCCADGHSSERWCTQLATLRGWRGRIWELLLQSRACNKLHKAAG